MVVDELAYRIVCYPNFAHSSVLTGTPLIFRLDACAAESLASR